MTRLTVQAATRTNEATTEMMAVRIMTVEPRSPPRRSTVSMRLPLKVRYVVAFEDQSVGHKFVKK